MMIYATAENLRRYIGINRNLDLALRYIEEQGLDGLHNGRNEVAGDEVYVNVFEYDTIPEAEAVWEAHAKYADIHIDLSGSERIGVSALSRLERTCFKEEEDFIGCEGGVDAWLPLGEGLVLIVFPEDAHMVKVQRDAPCHVRKAVFKVKV